MQRNWKRGSRRRHQWGEMVHLVTKETDVISRNNKETVKLKEQQEYVDGIQYSSILAGRERVCVYKQSLTCFHFGHC